MRVLFETRFCGKKTQERRNPTPKEIVGFHWIPQNCKRANNNNIEETAKKVADTLKKSKMSLPFLHYFHCHGDNYERLNRTMQIKVNFMIQ